MTYQRPDLYFVFDVESIGLHGEGFAVGYAVYRRSGPIFQLQHSRVYHCSPDAARGSAEGRAWVEENLPASFEGDTPVPFEFSTPSVTLHGAPQVREFFWKDWLRWRKAGAVMAADCPWPVEANFLHLCVQEHWPQSEWEGPYPLIDIASVRLAAGLDPLGSEDRLDDELPAHCPLADAKQSARLLFEALYEIEARSPAVALEK